jgi:hypothetical protein
MVSRWLRFDNSLQKHKIDDVAYSWKNSSIQTVLKAMVSHDRFQHIDFVIFIEGEAFEELPNE